MSSHLSSSSCKRNLADDHSHGCCNSSPNSHEDITAFFAIPQEIKASMSGQTILHSRPHVDFKTAINLRDYYSKAPAIIPFANKLGFNNSEWYTVNDRVWSPSPLRPLKSKSTMHLPGKFHYALYLLGPLCFDIDTI